MKAINIFSGLLVAVLIQMTFTSDAQTNESTSTWDNQIYIGNKVAVGKNNWRYTGELQVRLDNNMQDLEYWFLEGVATYMLNKKWEIVPDFRVSIKPDRMEYRPGFGLVYKILGQKLQFVNQLKWQIDVDTKNSAENGLRYVMFLNYKASEHFVPNFVLGGFYRWKDDFNGFQFFRFGPGLSYIINVQHSLNFNYMISTKNDGASWSWAGISMVQFVININKDYKYVPAKYFNF